MHNNQAPTERCEIAVEVQETDGVLDVIIRTVDDDEMKALEQSRRRPPKRVH